MVRPLAITTTALSVALAWVMMMPLQAAALAPSPSMVAQQDETSEKAETADEAEAPEETETTEAEVETEAQSSEDDSSAETTAETGTVIAKRGDRGNAVRTLQAALNAAGFSAGPTDGIFGRLTQAAVTAFQAAVGMEATGIYDTATATALNSYTPPPQPDTPPDPPDDTPTMTIREAQRLLVAAGFDPGPVDGLYGPKTRAGLQAFQRHVGIAVTGRLDAATIKALRGGPTTPPDEPDPDPDEPDDPSTLTLREAQRALKDGPFDPGPIDGVYGTKTKNAIWALEKLAGLPMDGQWGDAEQAALNRVNRGEIGGPVRSHSRRWIEVDLSQQLIKVYDPGNPVPILVSHVSSGSGIPWKQGRYSGKSITPVGSFTIFRRISGWRQSSLGIGSLYNPLYFTNSGIALHGSRSVPDYPASHGCVRVPMHIAEYLPGMLPNGTPVEVMP